MWSLCYIILLASYANSQLLVGGIGDDISTALNANSLDISIDESTLDFPADVTDQSCGRSNAARVWGAMLDNTYNGTFSYAEQAAAVGGENEATEGASMLNGFYNQATALANFLRQGQSGRALILMGHADMCTSQQDKNPGSCQSADQDPQNYCRTTPAAFERELRRGLDALIGLNNVEIIVFAPLRYSQICKFRKAGHTTESLYGTRRQCSEFWNDMASNPVFGFGPCSSLTSDCSSERISDAYNTQLKYFTILQSVCTQYKPTTPGLTAGNGTKVTFRDDLWNYQFQLEDISSCDCFHPSKLLQSKIANITFGKLQCSATTPCCDANLPETCGSEASISGAAGLPQSLLLGLVLLFLFQLFQ